MIKAYVCRAMSGQKASLVVRDALRDKKFLETHGFTVLCPVISEGVRASARPILASKELMDSYWVRDKRMIEEADVIFNMSPHMPSLGVIREYGYARFFLYKKTISVFPVGKLPHEGAVCYYEDDYVTDTLVDGIYEALRTHKTLWKRLKWRFKLYVRCLPKMVRVWVTSWK